MPPKDEVQFNFLDEKKEEFFVVPEHFHTTDKIDFRDIFKKKLYVHHTIYGIGAATAGNYGVFWIAPL